MLFCHECGQMQGFLRPTTELTLTGNDYQLEKFYSHTTGDSSVFAKPSFETYRHWTVTALASGWISVDKRNRVTMVIYAGEGVGLCRKDKIYCGLANAVRVVHYSDGCKIHPIPCTEEFLSVASCDRCGSPLPYNPDVPWFGPVAPDEGDDSPCAGS
jgi:hypothetical protein